MPLPPSGSWVECGAELHSIFGKYGEMWWLCNRRAKNDRASASLSEGDVVVPMEAMGEAYYRLANNNRVGGAVKAAAG